MFECYRILNFEFSVRITVCRYMVPTRDDSSSHEEKGETEDEEDGEPSKRSRASCKKATPSKAMPKTATPKTAMPKVDTPKDA